MISKNMRILIIVSMSIIAQVIFTGCQVVEPETAGGEENENGEPAEGGDLVVATPASPPTLDWAGQGVTETKLIAWHIFEQLFTYDENYDIKPMLVDDYEKKDDGMKYVLHLREGVKFHDGSTMKAEDVLASMKHWKEVAPVGKKTFNQIKKIELPDEYTLEIHLKEKYTALLSDLANLNHALFIMPKEKAEEAGGTMIDQEQIVGTGPYEFVNWDIGEQLTIKQFDDYVSREDDWGGLTGKKTAYHDEITFKVVSDSQVKMNGVISGEYDFAIDITPDLYEALEHNDTVQTIIQEMQTFFGLVFNHSKPPFKENKDLRHAVNYALNKEELLSAAYGSSEFYELDGSLFSKNQGDLYTDKGTDLYDAYDPEKAADIIDNSDYDGEPIKIITTSDYHDYEKIAQVVQKQLQEVGLNVEIESYEWGALFDKRDDPEGWDMLTLSYPWYYSPVNIPMFYDEDQRSGWADLSNIFTLQDEWIKTEDSERKEEILGEINKTIYDDMLWVQVGNSKGLNLSSTNLKGYKDWDNVRFWNTWSSD